MEKIILVDGNNLLFRSYYATAYNGNFMKNSKGFPTNALFGFTNMMNKIIEEENPTRIIVAFDKGKTFRHDKFDFYKEGRLETPEELKVQFPIAKEMLGYMGIKYYEIDNYEADDIIGTFASFCDIEGDEFVGTIVSSDKDLLQLVSPQVDIKLLKQKDYIRYNPESFREEYGIDPINIIDLKALMGDASDNIPGVKGIGEKTALKLLQEYKTLDGIYENIDSIKGAIHDKLVTDKDNAYMSYEIATIEKNVPMEINMDDILYKEIEYENLANLYEDLEFYSLLKKMSRPKKINSSINEEYIIVEDASILNKIEECAIFLETTETNYHNTTIIGMGVYTEKEYYYIPYELLKDCSIFLLKAKKYVYDGKKTTVALKWNDIYIDNIEYDTMIAAYLLEYNLKEDVAYLANDFGYGIEFRENLYPKKGELDLEKITNMAVLKAKFIYETRKEMLDKLEKEQLLELFYDIEMPLSNVLGSMEYNGINVDRQKLIDMGEEIKLKIEFVSQTIYNYVGSEFNISSPIQLGEILFEKLGLPHGKKGKTGYSTAVDVLEKLKNKHPVIEAILEYRMLTKLHSTYIEGLIATISSDEKIHTIYTQTLTRTGRLSSIEPNLQNIPIRHEYGRLIRKAFIPSRDSIIVSSDYSQIELRILAHIAGVETLIDAFNNNKDIHTKTASDIFKVEEQEVTKDMRRNAKAVNFGIIYGISSYGLSESTGVTPKEAGEFIKNYLETYPGIQKYMDDIVEKAHEDGYVRTMLNRKRTIPELNNKNYMIRSGAERMALNTPIQGTSADIIKKAMVELDREFNKRKIKTKLIMQVHDELVFDCLESEYEEVKEIIKDVMENTYSLNVPLKVDIEYGNDWYQAK
jgi:DNA polymerase I